MTTWLIDKSALLRLGSSTNPREWGSRVDRGLVRIHTVTLLEVGYSARSAGDWRNLIDAPPISVMPVEYVTSAIEERAVDVQRLLVERGQHRGPSIPDLLIAATAELARLTVLHVDKDYELIAEITGQAVERLTLRTEVGSQRSNLLMRS